MTVVSDRVWVVSITSLMTHFRSAMTALIPVAEATKMVWRNPDGHDEWETVSSALFEAVVSMAVHNTPEWYGAYKVPDYEMAVPTYERSSYIGLASRGERAAFFSLETSDQPFDTCYMIGLDDQGRSIDNFKLSFETSEFVLVVNRDGCLSIIDQLSVSL